MKRIYAYLAVLLFLLMVCVPASAQTKENSFASPDFAFPRTVSENACRKLDESVKSRDWLAVTQALVQLTLADNTVSADSMSVSIRRVEETARLAPAPWRQMMLTLEAALYNAAYTRASYVINSRQPLSGQTPEDMREWDKDMFARAIMRLCTEVTGLPGDGSGLGELSRLSVDDIAPLLQPSQAAIAAGDYMDYKRAFPTAAFVVAGMFSDYLQPFATQGNLLPFGAADSAALPLSAQASSLRADLADALFALARTEEARAEAIIMKAALLDREEGRAMVAAARKAMPLCPARLRLTLWLLDSTDGGAALAALKKSASEEIRQFKDAPFAAPLRARIARMSEPSIELRARGQYLSADSVSADVALFNLTAQRLLLVRVPATEESYVRVGTARARGKVADSVVALCEDTVSALQGFQVRFRPVEPGFYCVLPSDNSTLSGVPSVLTDKSSAPVIKVSDITLIFENKSLPDGSSRGYVVEGRNQKPVAGASVTLTQRDGKTERTQTCRSEKDGSFIIPAADNRSWRVTATSGASRSSAYMYDYRNVNSKESYTTFIYTDLGLYRPGAEVRFVCVSSKRSDRERNLLVPRSVTAELRDASGERVDTLSLSVQSDGRAVGSFRIPEGRMNGSWSIRAAASGDGFNANGSVWFQVAEYKTPTFFVEMDSIAGECRVGKPLVLRGHAATYSGMPVSGGKVSLTIRTVMPWWWRYDAAPQASYTVSAETGDDGTFEVTLATDRFTGTAYAASPLSVTADVTDAAGETQSSLPLTFSLTERVSLMADIPAEVSTARRAPLTVRAVDGAGKEVEAEIGYELISMPGGLTVKSGSFVGKDVPLELSSLAPGYYKIKFTCGDETSESTFILYDPESGKVPCETPLWVAPTKRENGKMWLRFGSGYDDSWLLVTVNSTRGQLYRKWFLNNGELIDMDVDIPEAGERHYVTILGMHNLGEASKTIEILSDEDLRKNEIETITFRDRLTPGAAERWTFRYTRGGAPVAGASVIATMTDKALDAIKPFSWTLPGVPVNPGNPYHFSWTIPGDAYFSFNLATRTQTGRVAVLADPSWYWYDQPFPPMAKFASRMMYKSAATAVNTSMHRTEAVIEESVSDECCDAVAAPEAMAGGAVEKEEEEIAFPPLRDSSCPVAFFKPLLSTDAEGRVEISFDVPDFNTTWALQLLAYDTAMQSAVASYEAVASKPVMVRCNAPRFLRSGDEAALRMTAFNNSGEAAPVAMRMEIFEPLGGRLLGEREWTAQPLEGGASRTEEFTFTVPEGIEALAVRVYASIESDARHTDGEQTFVAVLPAAEPVMESEPFWMSASQQELTMRLPKMQKEDKVWLTYCDNPVWNCVTALPDISADAGNSSTSIAAAIYAQSVGTGLANRYPQIREALRQWLATADSALLSPLEKNPELKTIALAATPWGGSARDESLRMLRLGRLLDKEMSAARMSALTRSLLNLQDAGGGFRWCPGMEPSLFASSSVLLCAGMSRALGYGPDDTALGSALKRALDYCDRELYLLYQKNDKSLPMREMLSWLYIKSLYPDYAGGRNAAVMKRDALASIEKDWRSFDIYDAATAAIVLYKEGRTATARQILESLSQKASRSASRGCWFDNLSSRGGAFSKLAYVSQALQAFAEIEPESDMTDGLRQWLVIQRQAEDWGSQQMLAGTVNAVLSCGTDWLTDSAPSEIRLGDRRLTPRGEAYTGAFTLELSPEEASKAVLSIGKPGAHPAWGAVMTRSFRKPADVRSASTEDVAIEKKIYRKTEKDGAVTYVEAPEGELKVGDEVRVVLTVTARRDIEFVAIRDSRAACLEPTEQLSGYRAADGLWYYQAVTDSSTDFFLQFLPKGVSIISYDCHADRAGHYSLGIATLQSEYAPAITAHSAGSLLECK